VRGRTRRASGEWDKREISESIAPWGGRFPLLALFSDWTSFPHLPTFSKFPWIVAAIVGLRAENGAKPGAEAQPRRGSSELVALGSSRAVVVMESSCMSNATRVICSCVAGSFV